MSPTRRQFMKESGSTLLGAAALGHLAPQLLFAEDEPKDGPSPPTLVAVYLRGGADSLNSIVPYGDPLYYKLRPNIAIAAPGTGRGRSALKLNNFFGLHPSMEPLLPLFERGHVAPIINAGSPHQTRSHFDAQDFMERAAPGMRQVTEGWLNRFLQATRSNDDSKFRALSIQPTLPRSLRGQYPVLAIPGFGIEHALHTFDSLYACTEQKRMEQAQKAVLAGSQQMRKKVIDAGAATISQMRELQHILEAPVHHLAEYPQGGFGNQMRDLAKLVKSERGLQIAAVDYGGWDHHTYMGHSEGVMARMLGDVSGTLAAFAQDLGPHFNRVLVLLMSEFGRTVRENGNAGTDHGHGGFMLAMGGMVKGRKIYGKWTGLTPQSLNENRDMPVHTDFRQVFAEALRDLYGFNAFEKNFFPGYNDRANPIDFLHPVVSDGSAVVNS